MAAITICSDFGGPKNKVCHSFPTRRSSDLDDSQAGIKIAVRNINNLRYVDDTILTEESKEKLKAS